MNYKLDKNEHVIFKDTSCVEFLELDFDTDEVIITNKNIVCDVGDGIKTLPIDAIKVYQGKPQIVVDNDFLEPSFEIYFTTEKVTVSFPDDILPIKNKIHIKKWVDAITTAVSENQKSNTIRRSSSLSNSPTTSATIIRCQKCGKQLRATDKFCSGCGQNITINSSQEAIASKVYCSKCGKQMPTEAKFCAYCGQPSTNSGKIKDEEIDERQFASKKEAQEIQDEQKRKVKYDGEIHKCPNCGEILTSFKGTCPSCGYELRGTQGTLSVKEFSEKYRKLSVNAQKIDLIRTFAIPNTKEDILEFVILASSNIDEHSYAKEKVNCIDASEADVADAWLAKIEQAYHKAYLVFEKDSDFEKVEKLYFDKKNSLVTTKENIKIEKRKERAEEFKDDIRPLYLVFGIIISLAILIGGGVLIGNTVQENKMTQQLSVIEELISSGEYDLALTRAYALSDSFNKSWSETRRSLINRIEALIKEENGETTTPDTRIHLPELRYDTVYTDAKTLFEVAGFTNVTLEKYIDNSFHFLFDDNEPGTVAEISINGSTDYDEDNLYEPDSIIIIRYYPEKE